MISSKKLRRRLALAALAVLAALLSMVAATFAWYVYNTSALTTKVKLAAGSSVSLQIAKEAVGPFKSSIDMDGEDRFAGRLNPVSTNSIAGGFQRAEWFDQQETPDGTHRLFAAGFGRAEERVDYHKTCLFLRTNAPELNIYLSDIGFVDADSQFPVSTALRLGLLVKQRDADGNEPEFIFEVNPAPLADRGDNADRVPGDGHVLDSGKTDGSIVPFTALTEDNFCNYNGDTGAVTLKPDSRRLFTLSGDGKGGYGEAVEVEVYLWLEGCDQDCTLKLTNQTLESLTLHFAGDTGKGA